MHQKKKVFHKNGKGRPFILNEQMCSIQFLFVTLIKKIVYVCLNFFYYNKI